MFVLSRVPRACRGKAFGGFSALYIVTAESFPTRLRGLGFGLASVCSRLAGTVTPFVAGTVWAVSPQAALLLYAVGAALCGATLKLFVADTRLRPMLDELVPINPSTTSATAPELGSDVGVRPNELDTDLAFSGERPTSDQSASQFA